MPQTSSFCLVRYGTSVAMRVAMAAVLCLILLPLIASVGFMLGAVGGDLSASSMFAGLVFVLLGGFMFFTAFNMSRGWDEEENG